MPSGEIAGSQNRAGRLGSRTSWEPSRPTHTGTPHSAARAPDCCLYANTPVRESAMPPNRIRLDAVAALEGCVQAGDGMGRSLSSAAKDQTELRMLRAARGAQAEGRGSAAQSARGYYPDPLARPSFV